MGYRLFDKRYLHVFDVALSPSKHRTVGGGLPAICREPAAKSAHAVCQMQAGAAAQPIAVVVTSGSSYALRAEAGVRAYQ